MRVGERGEPVDGVPDDPGVRVQEQEVVARCDSHPGVVPATHADVRLLDHPGLREPLPDELERAVRRAVVDDDRLVAPDALEAALEPRQPVQRDDDDGDGTHTRRVRTQAGRRLRQSRISPPGRDVAIVTA